MLQKDIVHNHSDPSPVRVLQSVSVLLQVQGTRNPDWGPISWPDDAIQHLRTPGLLTVCVYACEVHSAAHKRPTPGHILPRQPADQQKSVSHSTVQQQPSGRPCPTDAPSATTQASSVNEAGSNRYSSDSADQQWHQQDTPTESLPPPAAGKALILSAEVNLDELHPFQYDLAALDVCLPPNTLVLELADGPCLIPALTLPNASSDLPPLAEKASASIPVLPGSPARPDQAMTEHALPDADSVTKQVCSFKLSCQPFCSCSCPHC